MDTSFTPELLTEVQNDPDTLARFILDPNIGFQEKFNGNRRIVGKDVNGIWSLNKKGERRELPRRLAMNIKNDIPFNFIIDSELMPGEHLRIFDSIILGNRNMLRPGDPEPYEARIQAVRDNFSAPWGSPVYTAYTQIEKIRLLKKLTDENAEGLVCRQLHSPYKQGDSHQHFKIKFVKTLDAVVMGKVLDKDSVDLGLYDKLGRLQRISAASTLGKVALKPNDVVEVKYLFASRNNHIVQPRISLKRDDKEPRACTLDQLVKSREHQ